MNDPDPVVEPQEPDASASIDVPTVEVPSVPAAPTPPPEEPHAVEVLQKVAINGEENHPTLEEARQMFVDRPDLASVVTEEGLLTREDA